jgi:hypothetical protein
MCNVHVPVVTEAVTFHCPPAGTGGAGGSYPHLPTAGNAGGGGGGMDTASSAKGGIGGGGGGTGLLGEMMAGAPGSMLAPGGRGGSGGTDGSDKGTGRCLCSCCGHLVCIPPPHLQEKLLQLGTVCLLHKRVLVHPAWVVALLPLCAAPFWWSGWGLGHQWVGPWTPGMPILHLLHMCALLPSNPNVCSALISSYPTLCHSVHCRLVLFHCRRQVWWRCRRHHL